MRPTFDHSAHEQPNKMLEEAIYLLFVKASTLPVWLSHFRPEPEPTGTTVVSILSAQQVEGKDLYLSIAPYDKLTRSMGLKGAYGDISDAGYQREISRIFQLRQCHPQDCEYTEVVFQIDVYCSKQEGISLEEVQYIKHMVAEAHKENPDLNGYRLFLYCFDQVQDRRNAYKMAPEGFERCMVWGRLLMTNFRIGD